jgi:hypothetical protein
MTAARMVWLAGVCLAALGLAGCVLPSFKENGAADAGSHADAASLHGPACGLSAKLPTACDACIRESCCELAKDCGQGTECGKDLLEPITPVADFSPDFDMLLGCMQRNCDEACKVNWGCVDKYTWPAAKDNLAVDVTVIDFAAVPDKPLPGVQVQACQAVDPACDTGRVDQAQTNADGVAQLTLQSSFHGFFTFSGAGYLDSTMQWSEPIYRIAGFKQYQIKPDALAALAVISGVHSSTTETFNPDAGHLIFRVQGCLPLRYLNAPDLPRAEVANVQVSFEPNDGASRIFYTEPAGGVSVTLDATTSDGVGGSFEVPARNVTVHCVDAHTAKEVASGSVRVRAGAIGYTYLVPRSAP